MFCSNCGKEIDDRAVICVGCGVAVGNPVAASGQDPNYRPILGFILSFFFALVGAIISCVEYKKAKEVGGDHRFALAGMIIGFVYTGLIVLYFIFVIAILGSIVGSLSEYLFVII